MSPGIFTRILWVWLSARAVLHKILKFLRPHSLLMMMLIVVMLEISCETFTGDVIVTSNLTVVITAHGNSNGIFHFVPPMSRTVREGESVSFQWVLFSFKFSVSFQWALFSFKFSVSFQWVLFLFKFHVNIFDLNNSLYSYKVVIVVISGMQL